MGDHLTSCGDTPGAQKDQTPKRVNFAILIPVAQRLPNRGLKLTQRCDRLRQIDTRFFLNPQGAFFIVMFIRDVANDRLDQILDRHQPVARAAGTLLAVTLVLYAVRAGSTPTLVAIRSGQLEVTRGKTHEVFDLTSRFTRIEVVGKPGGRGWKVLFGRFGRDPLVINSSIVDPEKFTAELERYRWRRP